MGALATVRVHDDFPSRQARVAVGATDHKLSCGVHVKLVVSFEQRLNALAHRRLHTWNQHLGHVLLNLGQHG